MKPSFKPMLLPNNKVKEGQEYLYETGGLDIDKLTSPTYLVSIKRDGVRAEIGNGKLRTRKMEEFANKRLNDYFSSLIDLTSTGIILEGELYSESTPFDELSGILRSFNKELPEDLQFYCFDYLENNHGAIYTPFKKRMDQYMSIDCENFIPVAQYLLDKESIKRFYTTVVGSGNEGLVLKNPNGLYKLGRVTHKENICYKMKKVNSYDCTVIGFEPKYKNTSESYLDELGYKKKHKYKSDKIAEEKVGAIVATYEDQVIKVSPAMSDLDAIALWHNKEDYIGKIIEVKGDLSSKGKIRHPILMRFRGDKDGEKNTEE